MRIRTLTGVLALSAGYLLLPVPQSLADALSHSISGIVTRVDHAGKKLYVKSADGTEHVFDTSKGATVRAAGSMGHHTEDAAIDSDKALKQGSHVVVHYTKKGAGETASKVDDFGHATVKETRATVLDVDKGAHTLKVKTDDGAIETYHVASDASVDTKDGIKDFATDTSETTQKGAHVVLHFTQEAGGKVVHTIEKV
ncbi:MAG: hypothetical protein QOH35_2512 [Acidobacteriaceae bacterium]|nr:hypothetical protein [Acidobacteriaceae bacterium]